MTASYLWTGPEYGLSQSTQLRLFDSWTAKRGSRLRGTESGAHKIIDNVQPYLREAAVTAHPLVILRDLSNTDKHESIHLTRPRSRDTRFAFRPKGSSEELFVARPRVVFHDGTEVILTDAPEGLTPDMNVNIKGTLFVSFTAAGAWADDPVQEVLLTCIKFVYETIFVPLAPYTH